MTEISTKESSLASASSKALVAMLLAEAPGSGFRTAALRLAASLHKADVSAKAVFLRQLHLRSVLPSGTFASQTASDDLAVCEDVLLHTHGLELTQLKVKLDVTTSEHIAHDFLSLVRAITLLAGGVQRRSRLLEHFRTEAATAAAELRDEHAADMHCSRDHLAAAWPVKIYCDIDDTLRPSLLDHSYPSSTGAPYPGIGALLLALQGVHAEAKGLSAVAAPEGGRVGSPADTDKHRSARGGGSPAKPSSFTARGLPATATASTPASAASAERVHAPQASRDRLPVHHLRLHDGHGHDGHDGLDGRVGREADRGESPGPASSAPVSVSPFPGITTRSARAGASPQTLAGSGSHTRAPHIRPTVPATAALTSEGDGDGDGDGPALPPMVPLTGVGPDCSSPAPSLSGSLFAGPAAGAGVDAVKCEAAGPGRPDALQSDGMELRTERGASAAAEAAVAASLSESPLPLPLSSVTFVGADADADVGVVSTADAAADSHVPARIEAGGCGVGADADADVGELVAQTAVGIDGGPGDASHSHKHVCIRGDGDGGNGSGRFGSGGARGEVSVSLAAHGVADAAAASVAGEVSVPSSICAASAPIGEVPAGSCSGKLLHVTGSAVVLTRRSGRHHAVSGLAVLSARPALMKASTLAAATVVMGGRPPHAVLCGTLLSSVTHERMGERKAAVFAQHSALFPECRVVWLGDSGQGDMLAGLRMLQAHAEQERHAAAAATSTSSLPHPLPASTASLTESPLLMAATPPSHRAEASAAACEAGCAPERASAPAKGATGSATGGAGSGDAVRLTVDSMPAGGSKTIAVASTQRDRSLNLLPPPPLVLIHDIAGADQKPRHSAVARSRWRARGIHLFDSVAEAAAIAFEHGLLDAAALQQVVDATVKDAAAVRFSSERQRIARLRELQEGMTRARLAMDAL